MVRKFENVYNGEKYFEVDGKVIELYDSIEDYIEEFLMTKKDRSETTYRDYKSDIKFIAHSLFGKPDYKYLRRCDLEDISIGEMMKYFQNMSDMISPKTKRPYSNTTINRRISSLKELYKHLVGRSVIKYNLTAMHEYIQSKKDDSKQYDVLSLEDALSCIEHFKTLPSGDEMYFIGKIALETGLRANEILNLQWKNFNKINNNQVEIVSNGKERGKGGVVFSKIVSLDFYNELEKFKKEGQLNLFTISYDTVNSYMNQTIKSLGLDKDGKYYTFHSIRKTAVTFVYDTTMDITVAQAFAGHSSVDTTRRYIKSKEVGMVGYFSLSEGLNEDLLENASKEQLLEIIKNNKTLSFIVNKELSKNVENDKVSK